MKFFSKLNKNLSLETKACFLKIIQRKDKKSNERQILHDLTEFRKSLSLFFMFLLSK